MLWLEECLIYDNVSRLRVLRKESRVVMECSVCRLYPVPGGITEKYRK